MILDAMPFDVESLLRQGLIFECKEYESLILGENEIGLSEISKWPDSCELKILFGKGCIGKKKRERKKQKGEEYPGVSRLQALCRMFSKE